MPKPSLSRPTILITDNIHPQAIGILEEACQVIYEKSLTPEQLLKQVQSVDGLMVRSASQVTQAVLEAAQHLKIVGRAGVGTDNIDLDAATQRGVIVVNSPEGNTVAAAEHAIGMLMALARHIPEADASMKHGEWKRSKLVGVEVFGKTLGVVGLGRIGSHVAKVCQTLGMKVQVFDPYLTQNRAEELGVQRVALDEIWEKSDFITLHAPKTKETYHLLNRNTLARCKTGVRIINCARGELVDEVALAEALESGQVAGAALDVFSQEPLEADNPLLSVPFRKTVLTPHLGASTEEAQVNVALDVAEQIRDFFTHGYAKNAVNIPLLRKDILDPVKNYMPMAEVLGAFIRQVADGPIQSVEVIAQGALHQHRAEPLTLAVLKGILSTGVEGVNYVNATGIAEERGIQIKESTTKKAENYLNLLEVVLTTEQQAHRIAGTLISDQIFRIVALDDYRLDLDPTSDILLTPHHDRPGMIAKVATVLGSAGVNISALQVGRKGPAAGGESMMAFNLDSPLDQTVLDEICRQDGIYDAVYIRL